MALTATRLGNGPVIHSALHPSLGENINGPSVVRVSKWVTKPLGKFYLYFAHHEGTHIRMAYADNLTGPWTIYAPGVLDVSQSLFVASDPPQPPRSQWPDWVPEHSDRYLYAHIASPDVHLDHDGRRFRMYFHGLLENGDQQTRIAYSTDGLNFTPRPELLGPPYFRVFSHKNWIYAISWAGELHRSRSWEGPFEDGPDFLSGHPMVGHNQILRHSAVLCRNDRLDLFFSRIGDCPEHILHSRVKLSENWNEWQVEPPKVLLMPREDWEGGNLPAKNSVTGAANGRENAMRDPYIFSHAGEYNLFYCGGGESCIGLAQLTGF